MAKNIELNIILKAINQTNPAFSGLTGSMAKAQASSIGLGKALLGIGAVAGVAAIGLGVTAVKAAGNFQSQLTSLVTGAGESAKNIKMVGDGILAMSVQTATSTSQLTSGMYQIESAGYHSAAGLSVLKASAMGAKVGNADLGTVANATTTIMTDFGIKASNASVAVNSLVATVASGKTTMQQLSGSLSQVLPTAAAASIGLNDTMAAMATMTSEGVPAAQAATYLRQTIIALQAPSKGTVTALKAIGLNSADVANEMHKSLPSALQMITDRLGKVYKEGSPQYLAALKNIAGGSKQMQGMLDLTGKHIGTFKSDVSSIAGAVKKGGSSITGWSNVQGNFNFKLAQAGQAVNALMINVGQALLPVISKLLEKVGPLITKFSDWLTKSGALKSAATALANGINTLVNVGTGLYNFFSHNQVAMVALKAGMFALGGAILAALVPALIAGAAAAWGFVAPLLPFLAIGALVGLVIFGIVMAVQHWGQIVQWLKGVWGGISSWFAGLWGSIKAIFTQALVAVEAFFIRTWMSIKSGATAAWSSIVNFLKQTGQNILNGFLTPFRAIGALFQWLYNHNYYFKALVDTIRNVTSAGLAWLRQTWQTVVNFVSGLWQKLVGYATQHFGAVKTNIQTNVNAAWSFLQSIWNTAISWISSKWNSLANLANQAWQAVSQVFSGIWSRYIAGPLGNLWNSISSWFSNLAGQAVSWGSNLIQGFINGITSMLGNVGNAVSKIAGKVAGFLGFHSPSKEGPGRELMTWGPGLVQGFSQGIIDSIPMLQTALNTLMLPVAQSLTSSMTGNIGGLTAHPFMSPMTAPIAAGFRADPYNKASQLNFTQAPTEIYRSKLAPHETKAQKQKTAQTLAAEWKVVDAELKAIQVRGSAQLKNDRATYAAEIKAIQEHDKHLKGNAKKAGEAEIKVLRAQEKAALAGERNTLAAKLKAARAQEKQIKQEIKLELHVHANKVDAAEIDKISEATVRKFAEQIRSQFGNL